MPLLLTFAFVVQAQVALQPIDVRRVQLSPPAQVLELPLDEIKGEPDRLAWSPDGRQIYLRTAKADRWGNRKVWHYEIALLDKRLRAIDHEPDWYGRYWNWKSAQSAPGAPNVRIAFETRQERRTATGVVSAGALAQSGGDPSLGSDLGPQGQAIAQIVVQAQMVTTTTMSLKGELLGQFVNTLAVPGLTFGWAPATMEAIAYVNRKGHLAIMDRAGRKREVAEGRDALLPAWSEDGAHLAWVQRLGKKVRLFTADISVK